MARFPEVGDAFGAYRLVRVLGTGGRGTTYEAFDARLSRQVAIKLLDPELTGAPGFGDRFSRDAAALASLNALHVTQLHDHGERDGFLFLVSQFVPDGNLDDYLRVHGRPAPQVALSVVGQLCEAIADAECAGIVVDDVGPSDVLVRDRGSVLYAYLGVNGVLSGADPGPGAVPALGRLLWLVLSGSAVAAGTEAVPQLPAGDQGLDRLNEILRRSVAAASEDRYDLSGLAAALAGVGRLPASLPGFEASASAPAPQPAVVVEPVPAPQPAVVVEPVPEPAVVVEPPSAPEVRPLFVDEVGADEPEQPATSPETRRARGWRARRSVAAPAVESAEPEPEPEPEAQADPEPAPEPAPRARRRADRAADLGWLIPGGLLLVVPIVLLVVVFVLVNGRGGSNFGKAATTPPQTITQGEAFTFSAFKVDAGWKVVTDSERWQLTGLFALNVSTQPETAHFTVKFRKGKNALVALDCRTAELVPAQRQAVSCVDPASAAYDPGWDSVTVEPAF
ncbi:MAG: protein kinase [Propionibacteriales bacterium]|nr:protein kinase [Propionibacteriales bacterium]